MRAVAPIILMLALSACNNEPPAPKPVETEVPKQFTAERRTDCRSRARSARR